MEFQDFDFDSDKLPNVPEMKTKGQNCFAGKEDGGTRKQIHSKRGPHEICVRLHVSFVF